MDLRLRADLVFEPRRPAELAGDDQEHAPIEPAGREILDERRDGLVVEGHPPLRVVEDVAVDGVRIPVVAAVERHLAAGMLHDDRHKRAPRLHQAPRQERALAETVAAVAVADKVGLAREIEGLAGGGAGEHVEGADVEVVFGAHRCAGVDLAPQSIEARRQPRAIPQAPFHRRVEIQARDLELRR